MVSVSDSHWRAAVGEPARTAWKVSARTVQGWEAEREKKTDGSAMFESQQQQQQRQRCGLEARAKDEGGRRWRIREGEGGLKGESGRIHQQWERMFKKMH